MPEWVESLNAMAADAVRLAVAVLWQSAVLVALVCVGLQRAAPAVRYWLWQVVALKLLLMPFWTVALPLPPWPGSADHPAPAVGTGPPATPIDGRPISTSVPTAHDGAVSAPSVPRARAWLGAVSWPAWLLLAWLVGVAAQVGGLICQRWRLARLLRQTVPADASINATVADLSAQLGLRRPPRTMLLDRAGSPFVGGLWRPVLVLPRDTLAALDPGQLRQVLLHELAHVRRRDLLWGWLPEVARLVWWFNPVAWWVAARVRLERELACDQLVLAHGGASAADYAETLVRVVSQSSAP
jgi:beta-lactamase regulating signal transducer with metallopeptidase domain